MNDLITDGTDNKQEVSIQDNYPIKNFMVAMTAALKYNICSNDNLITKTQTSTNKQTNLSGLTFGPGRDKLIAFSFPANFAHIFGTLPALTSPSSQ